MSPPSPLSGKTVVLGVTGGIAAYKSAELVRLLGKAGARVRVIMTAAAQRFITPLTLQTLSGHPVATELFDLGQESQIGHIRLADEADLLLIAPATADVLGKLAHGLCDDLLSTVALACRAPLLLAPAMNVNMWRHPQLQANLRTLVERGARTCGPDAGELACGWIGEGRLVDPQVIAEAAAAVFAREGAAGPPETGRDLAGRSILISAGPTYEAIDPVRFIGNRSSGKMGFALAEAAARRGAQVTLVAGPASLPTPPGALRVDVESAAQMAQAVLDRAAAADAVIMSAAVADYRPAQVGASKLKKEALGAAPTIALQPTVDILAELGRRRAGATRPVLVGFAAETDDVEAHAAKKLREKRCDLVVANDVSEPGSGFGTDTNRVTLLHGDPPQAERLPQLPKPAVADRILDRLAALLATHDGTCT